MGRSPGRSGPAEGWASTQSIDSGRKCYDVAGIGPARSGEFVIGGDVSSVGRGPNAGRKIWWSPVHHGKDMQLVVRARLLDSPTDTMRYESLPHNVVYQGGNNGDPALRHYFFHTGPQFPKVGKWLAIATQGPDWGCFIMHMT